METTCPHTFYLSKLHLAGNGGWLEIFTREGHLSHMAPFSPPLPETVTSTKISSILISREWPHNALVRLHSCMYQFHVSLADDHHFHRSGQDLELYRQHVQTMPPAQTVGTYRTSLDWARLGKAVTKLLYAHHELADAVRNPEADIELIDAVSKQAWPAKIQQHR